MLSTRAGSLYLLAGQLFSEFGVFLLHAAQFFLLALEAKLQLKRLAAVTLRWDVFWTVAPEPSGAHHVSKQRPLRPRRVAHKVERRPKGIWERGELHDSLAFFRGNEQQTQEVKADRNMDCSSTSHSNEQMSEAMDVRLCVSGWGFCSGKSLGGASTSSQSSALLLLV